MIFICLTIVLLPDSPEPEVEVPVNRCQRGSEDKGEEGHATGPGEHEGIAL